MIPVLLDESVAATNGETKTSDSFAPTGDELLVAILQVAIGSNVSAISGVSVSDTLSGTGAWTLHDLGTFSTASGRLDNIMATARLGPTPGSGTVTFNWTGTRNVRSVIVLRVPDVDTVAPVTQSKAATGSTGTTLSGTLDATPAADGLVIASIIEREDAPGNVTPGANFTELAEYNSNGYTRQVEYDEASATTTFDWSGLGALRQVGSAIELAAVVVADTLSFTTQPANTQEDTVMANVVVTSTDNTDTSDVTLTIGDNPGSGTLGGDNIKAMIAGVATFNDLEINNSAIGYSLLANATGYDEVESAPFNITLEPADHLVWNSQPVDTQVDAIITPAMTVRALNSEGAVDPSQVGNVTIARQAGTGTLGGALTKAMIAGVATFDDVTYDTAEEDVQLRATHASLTLADSALFDVTASPPPSARRGFGIRMGSPLTMRI